jgi:hypothetical protein
MTTALQEMLFAAALFGLTLFACDATKVEQDGERVVIARHGNTSCVLVEEKVFCAPGTMHQPVRLATSSY